MSSNTAFDMLKYKLKFGYNLFLKNNYFLSVQIYVYESPGSGPKMELLLLKYCCWRWYRMPARLRLKLSAVVERGARDRRPIPRLS